MDNNQFRFCPKCAGVLEKITNRDGAAHLACKTCGFVFYQNSKPTASPLIIDEQNRILLVKRAIEPHFGKWDLPGGFLENGEDLVDGLKRETMEELGIEIEPIEVVTIFVDRYGNEDDDFHTFNVFVKSKMLSNNIDLDSENSEFAWFARENVPWKELAFENTKVAIKTFYNIKGGRPLF